MVDNRVEKLAHLCVHYSVAVKPKEKVVIGGSAPAAKFRNLCITKCLVLDERPS
jgi:leucyl aminopeptidase (aminopeptidase T)